MLQKAAKIYSRNPENSERSVGGARMAKSGPLEHAELANQIQGFGIPDHWDASEKTTYYYFIITEFLKVDAIYS